MRGLWYPETMGNPEKFSTLESLAVLFALPGLLFGGIVVKVTIWRLPGWDNTMAVVIPYGLLSLGLAACFLVTAAIARLRWRWFLAIVFLWGAMAAITLGKDYVSAARMRDPRPVSIELRRIDVLDSALTRPLLLVRTDDVERTAEQVADYGPEWDRLFTVDDSALSCLEHAIDGMSAAMSDADESVLEIVVSTAGGNSRIAIRRSRVIEALDAIAQCIGGSARERVISLRSTLQLSKQSDERK